MKTRKPRPAGAPPGPAPAPGTDPPATMPALVRQVLQVPRPQAKLAVSRAGDASEREADQVADHVMRLPEPGAERVTDLLAAGDRPAGRPAGGELHRKSAGSPAPSGGTGADATVAAPLAARLSALRSGGAPLPSEVRSFFEPRFGRDLGDVRLHTDPASGELARSLDARAFTLGTSIVFGPGEYAPGSPAGRHLIAHELTHVLQQTDPASPGRRDAGVPVMPDIGSIRPASASRAVVQRRVSPGHVAWARETNAQIERIQDAVVEARRTLNGDARTAITSLQEVQSEYTGFERRYDEAARKVKRGISAARAREQQIDDGLTAAVDLVLFAAGGPWFLAARATVRTLRAVSDVKSYVDAVGHAGTVAQAVQGAEPGEDPLSRIPVRSQEVNWDEAMTFALQAFRATVEHHDHLNGIADRCRNHVRFLGTVRDGSYGGADPQEDRHGRSAAAMAAVADEIIRRLAVFQAGVVSGPVGTFRDASVPRLRGRGVRDLEREITLRLIASLSYAEAAERNGVIRGGKDYLREIGLIDRNGNLLNFDTGLGWVTDVGAQVIRLLAQGEVQAMSMVGATAEWRGSFGVQGPDRPVTGTIEFAGTRETTISAPGSPRPPSGTQFAVAPAGTRLQAGDRVVVVGYSTSRSERTKWTSYGRATREAIQGEVTFLVRRR
jgi:hypothetical protein